jgi:fructose-1,6-bisphosphatase II
VGRGDKIAADRVATEAMRDRLNRMDFAGIIAIGEGVKDGAPMLAKGEKVGSDWYLMDKPVHGPIFDIAVDPLDGTTQTSIGGNEAMSVIVVAEEGTLLDTEAWYMHKLAYGPKVAQADSVDIRLPISDNVKLVAEALNKDIERVTVCVLNRPRHDKLIKELRELHCRIKIIQDCDITASIATAIPDSGIDLYVGIGGSPEGVISAAALKCMKGGFQSMLCEKDGSLIDNCKYNTNDLASGDVIFCSTGVTDGSLLKGVRWTANGPVTHTLTMRSESGTCRWINTTHGN